MSSKLTVLLPSSLSIDDCLPKFVLVIFSEDDPGAVVNELFLSLRSLPSWLINSTVCALFFLDSDKLNVFEDVILPRSDCVLLTVLCLSALELSALAVNDFASLAVNLSNLLGAVLSTLLLNIFAKNDFSLRCSNLCDFPELPAVSAGRRF